MNDRIRRQIRIVALSIFGLLILLFAHIAYIQIVHHDFWFTHNLNKRTQLAARGTERGKILDRKGEILAQSILDKSGGYEREYPYSAIFAPLIGYESVTYGRAGLEAVYNADLAGYRHPGRQLGPVARLLNPKSGNSLSLTVDAKLQQQAYSILANRRGAIVVLNVKTGAIIISVSKPSFAPNAIEKEWNTISTASNSPLLNRTVQGLYPPGSIVKIMIADAALRKSATNLNKQFLCEGQLKVPPDYILHESGNAIHGKVNLENALAVSCNVTFGGLALELGRSQMSSTYERFGFSKVIEELGEVPSQVPDFSNLGNGDLAQAGIGQSSLLTTPLKMATVAAAFANKGVVMKPYIVDKVLSSEGDIVFQAQPQEWLRATTVENATKVAAMMKTVVERGTGKPANAYSVSIAGKTGSAENPHGDAHAWFIGFAPVKDPQFAIAVIVENAGSGGATAAPIAGQILSYVVR
ncbi:MAG: penicillin-binding protein transpeptidase [Anaerosporomusa subterranea]|jgi:peptidoglycan glycosyltransferase|nr:penicillin-binding protein transpeptidase [Anaerosporomusa subterranea]